MLDLEQYIGSKIDWVCGNYFEDIMIRKNGVYVPQSNQRYCTTDMKIEPIKKYWLENIKEVCEMRIGFRANEMSRAKKMIERCDENGCMGATPYYLKHQYKKNKNKMEWFIEQEQKSIEGYKRTWRIDGLSYEEIIKMKQQYEMFDDDFNSCDGGYCGL